MKYYTFSDNPLFKKCYLFLHPQTFQIIDVKRVHHPIKASPTLPTSQLWDEETEEFDLNSEDEE